MAALSPACSYPLDSAFSVLCQTLYPSPCQSVGSSLKADPESHHFSHLPDYRADPSQATALSLSRSLSWMIAGPHRWSPHFYFRLFLVCFQQHSQKEPFEKQVRSRPSAPNSAGKNRVLPKACTSDPGPSAPLLPLSALPLCRATHACPRTLHWRFFLLRTPSAQILPGLVPHFLQLPGRPALTAP